LNGCLESWSAFGVSVAILYNETEFAPEVRILNTTARNVFLWIVIVVAVVVLWNFLNNFKNANVEQINYSEFTQIIDNGEIKSSRNNPIVVTGNLVEGTFVEAGNERRFEVLIPKGA
jgi:hypothetical protein